MSVPPPAQESAAAKIVCVLVNWNGWRDTVACLDSLREQDYPAFEVIVVDNGSTDDSRLRIAEAHPWATLLETGRNLGFATGCNAGTRHALQAGADYIWLLNNDTIAPPETARILLQKAKANPAAGAIGTVLYYMHDPAMIQAWGGGSVNLWTGYVSHFTRAANLRRNTYLTGASVLLPAKVCEEIGLFYEGFFMYCDDADLSLRLLAAGYQLAVCEDTAVLHKEGASSTKRNPLIDRYATTSCLRLLRRHAPIPVVSMAIYLFLRCANRLVRLEWKNLIAVWDGVLTYRRERGVAFTDRI